MAGKTSSVEGAVRLVDVNAANFSTLSCCGIRNPKHLGRQLKGCWLRENAAIGLRAKALLSPDGRTVGFIEYVPGEFAWRGVDASGYMFIHCIWVHTRQDQRKGWGSILVRACLDDAKKANRSGVAVLVRQGPWMADRRIFLANGFEAVDTAPPDYELLAVKFDHGASVPVIRKDCGQNLKPYNRGLTIIRSNQCPHIAKFADDIAETAKTEYNIEPAVIDLQSWTDAQRAPTPYAVFAVIHNGQLLADHQISRTRFRNIMNKLQPERRGRQPIADH